MMQGLVIVFYFFFKLTAVEIFIIEFLQFDWSQELTSILNKSKAE